MKKVTRIFNQKAFALPTVILVSVVMLGILTAILTGVSASTTSLTNQYFQQLAKEAAEAGLVHAQQCYQTQMNASFPTGQWPRSGYYLTADTACSGVANPTTPPNTVVASPNPSTASGGTNAKSWYVVPPSTGTPSLGATYYTLTVTGYSGAISVGGALTKTYSTTVSGQYPLSIYGVTSGNDTTCAIQSGQLYCWGNNSNGQVGNSTTGNNQLTPYHVQGALAGKYVQYVSTGKTYTCAMAGPTPVPSLAYPNTLYCWGDNSTYNYGKSSVSYSYPVTGVAITGRYVGCPSTYPSPRPPCVPISASDQTCVLGINASNSAEYCWGTNTAGQAGEISAGSAPDPKIGLGIAIRNNANGSALVGVQTLTNISGDFSCNVDNGGGSNAVYCWGRNSSGQFGTGTANSPATSPLAYATNSPLNASVFKVANNAGHVCALKSLSTTTASVYCWGNQRDINHNLAYLLGNSSQTGDNVPSPVLMPIQYNGTSLTNISDIALADEAICVVNSGSVYCWGYNNYGQLGQGSTNSQVPPAKPPYWSTNAQKVGGALAGQTVVSITSGNFHFCAMTATAQTFCWGANWLGQLGNGSTTSVIASPTQVRLPAAVNF